MKLPLLVLALSIITSNSLPLTIDGTKIQFNNELKLATNNNLNKVDGLLEMANGDYSLNGIGSVSQELKDYGIDVIAYNAGLATSSRPLMINESEDGVYIYTYDIQARLSFDKISFSFDTGINDSGYTDITLDPDFKNYDIQLVSTSSTHKLSKWKILGYTPNLTTSHAYYSRQLFDSSNADKSEGIFPAVMTYQYNASTKEFKCDLQESVTITNKAVAWQLLPFQQPNTGEPCIHQIHYVAFNTSLDDKMDYISKIELEYNAEYVGGTLYKKAEGNNDDTTLNGITNYNFLNNFSYKTTKPYNNNQTVKVQIEPETNTYEYSSGFWFWRQDSQWIIDTITTYDDLISKNPDVDLISENKASKYKWFVNFLTNDFWAGIPVNANIPGSGVYSKKYDYCGIGLEFPIKITNQDFDDFSWVKDPNSYAESSMAIDIKDLTILRLWYYYQGEEHEVIAIDTYTDSSGTNNIFDPHRLTFEEWWASICEWWTNNWEWVVAIIIAIIAIPLIVALMAFVPQIFSLIKYIGKALLWIITAPFKLIIWLFKKPDR